MAKFGYNYRYDYKEQKGGAGESVAKLISDIQPVTQTLPQPTQVSPVTPVKITKPITGNGGGRTWAEKKAARDTKRITSKPADWGNRMKADIAGLKADVYGKQSAFETDDGSLPWGYMAPVAGTLYTVGSRAASAYQRGQAKGYDKAADVAGEPRVSRQPSRVDEAEPRVRVAVGAKTTRTPSDSASWSEKRKERSARNVMRSRPSSNFKEVRGGGMFL